MVHYDPNSPFRNDQQKHVNRTDAMERNEQYFRTTRKAWGKSWRPTEIVYYSILGTVAAVILLWPLYAIARMILS